jgi:protein fantom
LKERINDTNRENECLKEANEKLLNSAFSLEREREFREKERALKIQIAQLEATLKCDVTEKGSIIDKLSYERSNLLSLL